MEQDNSKRVVRKASYEQIRLSERDRENERGHLARGLAKANFLRALVIDRETLQALREQDDHEVALLARIASDPPQSNLDLAGRLAAVPVEKFLALAAQAGSRTGSTANSVLAGAFAQRALVAPVGRLHLERLEMSPAGTERGEMVFTVPLTPTETVTVSHKEWATSRDEYEQIVQDSFETYSEKGVSEKTDASMSAENETKHSSAFNFNASASGGYGPVSMTVSTGVNTTSDDRRSVKESTEQSREITEKASARARQEHKVSVKLETVHGSEDLSYRTITNPFADKAMRVDYFRMMRKWQVDQFRYGLRLTFDIPVPNPGVRLWAQYQQVKVLDEKIAAAFGFELTTDQITPQNPVTKGVGTWAALAKQWGVAVEPPPPMSLEFSEKRRFEGDKNTDGQFEFVAPDGYLMNGKVNGRFAYWGPAGQPSIAFDDPSFTMQIQPAVGAGGGSGRFTGSGMDAGPKVTLSLIRSSQYEIEMTVVASANVSTHTLEQWQQRVWATLRDAAFARYQAEHSALQGRRDTLWRQLMGKDTLTLRRMEREELLRGVLLWLVGPEFETSPAGVDAIIRGILDREEKYLSGAPVPGPLSRAEWEVVSGFGERVTFIHQAVEWENLLYFLYPYFWGSDELGRQKLPFDHPDPLHRDFLRAGYARVVVPIRPGFEEAFTSLLETGDPGNAQTPYLTIAEEVAAFARTNYAGIPPANPERHARPLLYPQQRKTWATMETVIEQLEAAQQANGDYPATLADLPGAPFTDAWGNDFVYTLPGSGNDYDLISLGADGQPGGDGVNADISAGAGASLMASWFEYTPTSGIDIDVQTIALLL
ncbi:type II secretion system protein GspG [Terrabacter sp. 2TAF16]|uniref:type II secretion system protein GspG n=1 Tax=Terrabacter sp. 2TAF16 TaxID=3233008 RepID=UPI003F97F037